MANPNSRVQISIHKFKLKILFEGFENREWNSNNKAYRSIASVKSKLWGKTMVFPNFFKFLDIKRSDFIQGYKVNFKDTDDGGGGEQWKNKEVQMKMNRQLHFLIDNLRGIFVILTKI